MKATTAARLVAEELDRARAAHAPMHSAHEGFAVLKEEVDELWEEVKAGTGPTHRGVSEAVQVAAMAQRFLIDLCAEGAADTHERKVKGVGEFAPRTFGGYSG